MNDLRLILSLTPVPPLPEGEGYGWALRGFVFNEGHSK